MQHPPVNVRYVPNIYFWYPAYRRGHNYTRAPDTSHPDHPWERQSSRITPFSFIQGYSPRMCSRVRAPCNTQVPRQTQILRDRAIFYRFCLNLPIRRTTASVLTVLITYLFIKLRGRAMASSRIHSKPLPGVFTLTNTFPSFPDPGFESGVQNQLSGRAIKTGGTKFCIVTFGAA